MEKILGQRMRNGKEREEENGCGEGFQLLDGWGMGQGINLYITNK
jgi:hypothetical protein